MSHDIHADVAALGGSAYEVLYVDCPWTFKSNSAAKPGRNAMRHYPTMSLKAIEAIPVKAMMAEDSVCFFWIPPAFLAIGAHLPIFKAWGFDPKSNGFTWVKLNPNVAWHQKIRDDEVAIGTGLTTRKQAEQVLIGGRGRSLRVNGNVREVVFAAVREHSRKPPEIAKRIEAYVGPGRRMVEMFGRESRKGWTVIGNEAQKFDEAAE